MADRCSEALGVPEQRETKGDVSKAVLEAASIVVSIVLASVSSGGCLLNARERWHRFL